MKAFIKKLIIYTKNKKKIVVNEEMIKIIEKLENKGSIIFIPNNTSYVDFLIISYILYAYKLKCPFVNSTEDFLNISILSKILRSSGAFFTKKNKKNYGKLYSEIVSEYLKILLEENCNIEIFLEVSRSRSGKVMNANNEVFDIFSRTFLRKNIENSKNIYIIPISVNYERVIEGETFPFEILGEEKVKESLPRLLRFKNFILINSFFIILYINRSLGILKMNFGRVFVEFCEPINVQNFFNNESVAILKEEEKVMLLRKTVMKTLSKASVIMPTSIVASLLLMQSKGINEENLVARSSYLVSELIKRKKKVGSIISNSTGIHVRNSCKLLGNAILHKKDMFTLSFTPKFDYKNILLLAFYRNSLMNALSIEAKGAISIFSFGYQIAYKEGVSFSRFEEEVIFINKLLKREFFDFTHSEEIFDSMLKYELIEKFESNGNILLRVLFIFFQIDDRIIIF